MKGLFAGRHNQTCPQAGIAQRQTPTGQIADRRREHHMLRGKPGGAAQGEAHAVRRHDRCARGRECADEFKGDRRTRAQDDDLLTGKRTLLVHDMLPYGAKNSASTNLIATLCRWLSPIHQPKRTQIRHPPVL